MRINADHAVALGAAAYAYQASNKKGYVELNKYHLLDIDPRTVGVLVKRGLSQSFCARVIGYCPDLHRQCLLFQLIKTLLNSEFSRGKTWRTGLRIEKLPAWSLRTISLFWIATYMLEATVYTKGVKEELDDAAQQSEKSHLEIFGISFCSCSKCMGMLRSYTAFNHVECCLSIISGHLDVMLLYTSKLTSKPVAFITNVRTFVIRYEHRMIRA